MASSRGLFRRGDVLQPRIYRHPMSSKRKRKSSESSIGDIENIPARDAKRIRDDDSSNASSDIDCLATDERLPLAELSLGQPFVGADLSDSEWVLDSVEVTQNEGAESESEDNEGGLQQPTLKLVTDRPSESTELDVVSSQLGRDYTKHRRHIASKTDLMDFFKRKERTGSDDRTHKIFENNPGLQPKMRSVLLEWIVEVCDVYKLHRETYHLTVDYLDRYLSQSKNISKAQLQLIGVTALLIAAKYEEIYPPKISDFAYITDGACTDQDIIKMEALMVQVLEWRCTVITSNAWVLGFLQLLCCRDEQDCGDSEITKPLYKHNVYEAIAHLLDLCSLDCGFVRYHYKVLALSSIHTVITEPDTIILKLAGYIYEDLADCIDWMQPFWMVLGQKFNYVPTCSNSILTEDAAARASNFSHLRIKHNVDLGMLDAVQRLIEEKVENNTIAELLLTPPSSSEKRKGSTKLGSKVIHK